MALRKPMPFIRFYLDDYLVDTPHLSTLEHGAYLLILFNYWRRQKPLPEIQLASIAMMSAEDFASIRDKLAEFFDVRDGVWHHKRVESELQRVKEEAIRNRRAGKKSAKVRREKAQLNARSTLDEQTSNTVSTSIRSNDVSTKPVPIAKIRLSKAEEELMAARDRVSQLETVCQKAANEIGNIENGGGGK